MILYTIQRYDLREHREKIDLEKVTYRDLKRVFLFQKKLYKEIGTSQVLWFLNKLTDIDKVPTGHPTWVHTVMVDERDIFRTIDSVVWLHLIGYKSYIPKRCSNSIKEKYCYEDNYRDIEKELEKKWIKDNLPSDREELWNLLLDEDRDVFEEQILTHHPLVHSEILNVEAIPISEWTASQKRINNEFRK